MSFKCLGKHIFLNKVDAVSQTGSWWKCVCCGKMKVFDYFNGKEIGVYNKQKLSVKIKLFLARNINLHFKTYS